MKAAVGENQNSFRRKNHGREARDHFEDPYSFSVVGVNIIIVHSHVNKSEAYIPEFPIFIKK